MKKNNQNRDSNIELLRIISMILIILHHMVYHTKIYMYSGENHILSLILLTGGKIAVIVYILIMGYYSKKSKFNIKKPINIILKTIIYTTLFMVIFKDKYQSDSFDDDTKELLMMMIAKCTNVFEILPILQYHGILINVLYSGVWTKLELIRQKKEKANERSL